MLARQRRGNYIGLLIITFLSLTGYGQGSSTPEYHFRKETSLALGYDLSFAEPNEKNFHLLETRVQKQRSGGRHPAFNNLNMGLIIGLNTERFLLGPVIGGILGYGGFVAGLDLAYFTDFNQGTLRLIPFLGIGFERFRITINPHIRLTKVHFEPINRGHLNLTFKLFSFGP